MRYAVVVEKAKKSFSACGVGPLLAKNAAAVLRQGLEGGCCLAVGYSG